MTKLRVGVIGVGYLGSFHAQKYAAMGDVDLVGVVDTDARRADKIAGELGTAAYYHHRDLMGKVDAVSIVVPTPLHFEVTLDFLDANVNVLVEKPMTTSVHEADRLLETADSRGVIIQVGHLERFNPAVLALKDIVKRPRFIESHRLSIYTPRCTDVSVVLDLMIHDIDIILNFVRSKITGIHAAGIPVVSDHVDIANARLAFENGCVANVTASRISMKNERKIRLFQRDAYIAVDFANHEITVVRGQDGNEPVQCRSESPGESRNDAPISGLIPGMEVNRLCFTKGDALADEIGSFVHAVTHSRPPAVTGRMGRDALKIALAIMAQIRSSEAQFLDR